MGPDHGHVRCHHRRPSIAKDIFFWAERIKAAVDLLRIERYDRAVSWQRYFPEPIRPMVIQSASSIGFGFLKPEYTGEIDENEAPRPTQSDPGRVPRFGQHADRTLHPLDRCCDGKRASESQIPWRSTFFNGNTLLPHHQPGTLPTPVIPRQLDLRPHYGQQFTLGTAVGMCRRWLAQYPAQSGLIHPKQHREMTKQLPGSARKVYLALLRDANGGMEATKIQFGFQFIVDGFLMAFH